MPAAVPKNHFLLLYGSQTGQAKAIAEEICEKSEAQGLSCELHCLSAVNKKFQITKTTLAVFVVSTTGDGEPPETACKAFRMLRKRTLPNDHLAQLQYSVLGLGDSNYTNFCNAPRELDRRLEELGAQRFFASAWADDGVGLEITVEPWIEGLFPVLRKHLGLSDPADSKSVDIIASSNESAVTDCSTDARAPSAADTDVMRNGDGEKRDSFKDNQKNGVAAGGEASNRDLSAVISESRGNADNSATETDVNNSSGPDREIAVNGQCDGEDGSQCGEGTEVYSVPSIRYGQPPLTEAALSIPVLPPPFLALTFSDAEAVDISSLPLQNGARFPSAASDVVFLPVSSADVLTAPDAVKKTLRLTLGAEEWSSGIQPGDAVSVICPNHPEEVQALLQRLQVADKADVCVRVSVIPDTKKRNAAIPDFIPPTATLRHILSQCLDFRDPPKKALLRVLVEHTGDEGEKRRLQELCSKQGGQDFTRFVREPALSLPDLLHAFPSCQPPPERLLEHLPRLQPRPYSMCSALSHSPGRVSFAFNVVQVPAGEGRHCAREGLCTGWLNRISQTLQRPHDSDLSSHLASLSLQQEVKIPVFKRTNQHFRPPEDLGVPLILVGPGTGVAPFLGFLQDRQVRRQMLQESQSYGETWLFFGCRHKDKDFLFREELEGLVKSGTLSKLQVCFSRDDQLEGSPRYVQHALLQQSQEVSRLLDCGALVYVCGDARNMAKDVLGAFAQILVQEKGLTEAEANAEMMKLRLQKRYLEDVWT